MGFCDAKRSGARKGGRDAAVVAEAKKTPQAKAPAPVPGKKAITRPEEPAADKRTVFVVKAAVAAAAAEVASVGNGKSEDVKRAAPDEEAKPVAVARASVRTSRCSKEEVDAILIQCGRGSSRSPSSGAPFSCRWPRQIPRLLAARSDHPGDDDEVGGEQAVVVGLLDGNSGSGSGGSNRRAPKTELKQQSRRADLAATGAGSMVGVVDEFGGGPGVPAARRRRRGPIPGGGEQLFVDSMPAAEIPTCAATPSPPRIGYIFLHSGSCMSRPSPSK